MTRILVIDDDPSLLQMVRVMLEREGHQVITAENGEEGLAAAIAQGPELAIVDVMMPTMSGYQVTRNLRSDRRTQALPILILTARSQQMDRQMALEAGANAHLIKPITSKELLSRIDELVTNHGLPQGPGNSGGVASSSASTLVSFPTPSVSLDDRSSSLRRPPIGADDPQDIPQQPAEVPTMPPANVLLKPSMPTNLPVITVIGLRGGSGATTVAVNLASLIHERRGRVCMIDLSMSGGHVGLHLHMAPRQNWGDLIGMGDNADPKLIGSLLVPHPATGLSLMAAPPVPPMTGLSQNGMTHVLNVLSGGFTQLVVDVDTLTPAAVGALQVSHAIIVVLGDDVMSVHTTTNLIQALQKFGIEMGRVRIAVSHSRPEPGVPPQTIVKALGRPISADIPYEPTQIQAVRRGLPLVTTSSESPFSKALQQLLRTF